jgi:hypothetical protein
MSTLPSIIRAMNHPDDGGSTHLWNVSQLQRDYTAVHPRRLYTSQRKLFSGILFSSFTHCIDEIGCHQCGFRLKRSTCDHVVCILQIKWEYIGTVLQLLIDLSYSLHKWPVFLSGCPVSRHLWSEWENRRRKWEFSISVPVALQEIFRCRIILRNGTSGFTSHPKESVLRIFIALKNPSP